MSQYFNKNMDNSIGKGGQIVIPEAVVISE
jgi:hypothetical protein